ncbi:Hsp20/alpha crystallin family protein [Bacillus marinisedimentorum]|uniref:Hsp20/alpha crystallin family protein n=1 Tax=Bacillus marinisedimentorum TaxID=1821260 RepID=UPI000872E524|nr:Hsp20/alpha crystallin family protein [Bacillus marinisedimentorum]
MSNLTPLRRKRRDMVNEMLDSFSDIMNDNLLTDRLFNEKKMGAIRFKTDVRDTGDMYIVDAELPGFSKEDITITYEGPYLTIEAVREYSEEEKEEHYIRKERQHGTFLRRFYLENIQEGMIDAEFKNGVLKIEIPKLVETDEHEPSARIPIR